MLAVLYIKHDGGGGELVTESREEIDMRQVTNAVEC